MEKNLKIEKLSDIVAWADGLIKDGGYNEEKYRDDAVTAYCNVKAYELWKIRDTVLKGMERHAVYTNSLNNDIADKAAKIDLLEKEIEGRKEGYYALKTQMDSSLAKKDEEIEELNKEVEKRCKDIVSQAKTICVLEKENATRRDLAKMNKDTIVNQYEVCEEFKNKITELEKELAGRKKTIELLDEKVERQRENLNALNKTLEIKTKENERLIAVRNNQDKEIEGHEAENARLSEKIIELKRQNEYLTKELDESYKAWDKDAKNHSKRDMTLVDELAKKNDEIKDLKETIEEFKGEEKRLHDWNNALVKDIKHWKDQERIRTDQLRATESKVEELWKRIEKLEEGGDDHGRAGFKRYIEYLVKEEETKFKESWKVRLNEELEAVFKEEAETAKKELNEEFGYGWEIAVRLRSEVDKKRIVDIGEGAEKILGVSRELFDAAIKALVDDGYQEIIGRIPQATNSYIYMDMHVLATPDVKTKDAADPENIKSLDSGIPCGSDSIE